MPVLPWQRSELDIWSSVDTGYIVSGLEVVDVPVSFVVLVEQVARKCVQDSFSEKNCKVSNGSNKS